MSRNPSENFIYIKIYRANFEIIDCSLFMVPTTTHIVWSMVLTRALLGLWISHRLLGGGGRLHAPPPMISAPGRRREKRKAAFESSRKIILKSFRSFFGSGQNWGLQGSKFQKFPKRFFDNKIFNFEDRATNFIPSCLSRYGASNHI